MSMPGAGIGPRTHRHDSASLCQSKETEDHKYMIAKKIGDMMTTYGSKGGKGLDKLGENQQMLINWGDVRNIHSKYSII